MTESATVCARLSAIRSSVVGGSVGHTRIAMLAIGTGTAAASSLETLPRAARGGRAHALDERHRVGERKRPRSRGVQVTAHRPRPFVVMRVRRQTALGEVDAPAIEQLAAGRDRDEHRRVTVLDDADAGGSLRSSSRHVLLLKCTLRPTGLEGGDSSRTAALAPRPMIGRTLAKTGCGQVRPGATGAGGCGRVRGQDRR